MGQCGCSGDLNIAALALRQKRTLLWVMMINFATFGLMVTGSLLSGSSALLSGTLDNLGDASAYLVSLAVVSASARAKAWAALFKSALIGLAAVAVLGQLLVKGPEPGARCASPTSAPTKNRKSPKLSLELSIS